MPKLFIEEWIKVIWRPLGIAGFALFLVFIILYRTQKKIEPYWLTHLFTFMAVTTLIGGLGIALFEVSKTPIPVMSDPPGVEPEMPDKTGEGETIGPVPPPPPEIHKREIKDPKVPPKSVSVCYEPNDLKSLKLDSEIERETIDYIVGKTQRKINKYKNISNLGPNAIIIIDVLKKIKRTGHVNEVKLTIIIDLRYESGTAGKQYEESKMFETVGSATSRSFYGALNEHAMKTIDALLAKINSDMQASQ